MACLHIDFNVRRFVPSASALAASDLSGTVSGANGGLGTNVSGFAASSIITTDGDGTVSELAKGSNSTVLKVSSGGTLQYAQADLTADVTGTLPVGNGGTGLAAVGTVNKFLMSTGSANQYNYVSALRDAAGKSAIEVSGTLTDNIKLVMTNTASNVTLTATDPDNGSANIDLPGVNTAGNQNTTGNAASVLSFSPPNKSNTADA